MKTRITFLLTLLFGVSAPAAFAQQQQPTLSVSMTEVDVFNEDFVFGSNPPYDGMAQGRPLNGGFGPYQDEINMWAQAIGTNPVGGFTYTFYVNGNQLGVAVDEGPSPTPTGAMVTPTVANTNNYPQGVSWTPPQPGVYYFSCSVTDGLGHAATSLAIEYFATGIAMVSPVTNSIVPYGSSVVVEAAAATQGGAVSRVDFWVDGGPNSGGTFLGTSVNYPYSVIYTPPSPTVANQVHEISADSYDASGNLLATSTATSVVVANPVMPIPTCVISTPQGTPAVPSTLPIPNYVADASASIPVVVTATGVYNISEVQLYIDGVLFQTVTVFPYTFSWQPTVTGIYNLTALAYDSKNNVVASTTSTSATITPSPTTVIIGALPTVAITSPANGATLNGGGTATMTVSASDSNLDAHGNPVAITQVQFFQDGNLVGTATEPTTPGGNTYTITFTATQIINSITGLPGESALTASATDSLGFSNTSPAVDVTVTSGGSGGGTIVGIPPTVSITNPTAQESVVVNTPVTLAATGTAPNGNIVQIEFLVDNNVLSTATQYPYSVIWTPKNLGTYKITAQVTDNLGDKVDSTAITVTVVNEPPPTVSITSPTSGGIITAGAGTTITATAASSGGTIASVQFYANGISIGTSTTPPYTISWTPQSAGVYTLTAVTTDNSGEVSTSSPAIVEAVVSTGGLGNAVYFGQYEGLKDGGRFAFAIVDGTTGCYIGHSSASFTPATAFYSDLGVSSGGSFSATGISGNASVTGVTGTLSPSSDEFIGTVTQAGVNPVAAGYYTGSIVGDAASHVTAIVGYDGEIMVYVADTGFSDAGDSTLDSGGNFTIVTPSNNTITGTVNPSTGFMTGKLTGGPGGSILAGRVSGGTFSDGVIRNISTRGQIGVGGNNMIAGFVVGGQVAKQLLVRAVGPTLSTFGLQGAIQGTQLSIYSGSTLVAQNIDGWSTDPVNAANVAAAEFQSGAFALPTGSADSALVGTFAPGAYTALVTGLGTDTGIGLVEVYDLDQLLLFSTQKLVNVSTRGTVGTNANVLIGGISIDGAAPKRLLIRAAGPALAPMGVPGSLAAPHLLLYNNAQALIRENFSWQTGNDPGLVAAAESQTGAFAFMNGSADSAILIVLPPGNYTAEVSGVGGTTGTALVEVYEIP